MGRPVDPRLNATKHPTVLDIAWAAGIYEGEGYCVMAGRTPTGHGRNEKVEVAQKDPELLYRLRDLFGGSVNKIAGRFPHYRWILCSARARAFLMTVYSFLTQRRKKQILALGFIGRN